MEDTRDGGQEELFVFVRSLGDCAFCDQVSGSSREDACLTLQAGPRPAARAVDILDIDAALVDEALQ